MVSSRNATEAVAGSLLQLSASQVRSSSFSGRRNARSANVSYSVFAHAASPSGLQLPYALSHAAVGGTAASAALYHLRTPSSVAMGSRSASSTGSSAADPSSARSE